MADPYLGQVQAFAIGYAPRGWAECNGQVLPINQNQALFSILGTTYGGNGQTTFALPDLRGRVPIHVSTTIPLGTAQGAENHTVTVNEMPAHNHFAMANSIDDMRNQSSPVGHVWAAEEANAYGTDLKGRMHGTALGSAGGGQPHSNMQPYTVIRFCIALQGIFPSPN